jgi:hypothetical protein
MPRTDSGTLREKSLHAALKIWYALPGDRLEVPVEGYLVDIVRGDLLIEIQTRNFSAIKRKLFYLTNSYPVRLVHPIAQEKWILRIEVERARRAPEIAPARPAGLFCGAGRFPPASPPQFLLEVLSDAKEIRINDDRAWRRKGASPTAHLS